MLSEGTERRFVIEVEMLEGDKISAIMNDKGRIPMLGDYVIVGCYGGLYVSEIIATRLANEEDMQGTISYKAIFYTGEEKVRLAEVVDLAYNKEWVIVANDYEAPKKGDEVIYEYSGILGSPVKNGVVIEPLEKHRFYKIVRLN